MKKITLFICLAIASLSQMNAQEVGQNILGGSLSYASSTNEFDSGGKEKDDGYSINAIYGKMINDEMAIGAYLGYTDSSEVLTIVPFLRIHKPISENLKYYIEPSIGTIILGNLDSDLRFFNVGLNVGLLYFVAKNWSFEFNLVGVNYSNLSYKDSDSKQSNFSIESDLTTPSIGVKYYF